jgi:hypothetical protein
MNTETLTGTTVRDMIFHAGKHAKHVPAGTEVAVSVEQYESDLACIYVRLVSNPRITNIVYRSAIVPA